MGDSLTKEQLCELVRSEIGKLADGFEQEIAKLDAKLKEAAVYKQAMNILQVGEVDFDEALLRAHVAVYDQGLSYETIPDITVIDDRLS